MTIKNRTKAKDNAKTVNNFLTWYSEDFFCPCLKKYFGPLLRLGKFLTQLSSAECIPHPSGPRWSPVIRSPFILLSDKDKEHKIAVSWMESEETQSTQLTIGETLKTQFDRTQMVLLLSWLSWRNKNWNNLFRKELTTFYRSQVQSLSTLIFNWLTDWLTDAL